MSYLQMLGSYAGQGRGGFVLVPVAVQLLLLWQYVCVPMYFISVAV